MSRRRVLPPALACLPSAVRMPLSIWRMLRAQRRLAFGFLCGRRPELRATRVAVHALLSAVSLSCVEHTISSLAIRSDSISLFQSNLVALTSLAHTSRRLRTESRRLLHSLSARCCARCASDTSAVICCSDFLVDFSRACRVERNSAASASALRLRSAVSTHQQRLAGRTLQ